MSENWKLQYKEMRGGKKIVVTAEGTRSYGPEYRVDFYDNDRLVHSTVVFKQDLPYVKQAGPRGFENATVERRTKSGRLLKKVT